MSGTSPVLPPGQIAFTCPCANSWAILSLCELTIEMTCNSCGTVTTIKDDVKND